MESKRIMCLQFSLKLYNGKETGGLTIEITTGTNLAHRFNFRSRRDLNLVESRIGTRRVFGRRKCCLNTNGSRERCEE